MTTLSSLNTAYADQIMANFNRTQCNTKSLYKGKTKLEFIPRGNVLYRLLDLEKDARESKRHNH